MAEYKTLADIPYEVLLERAVFILSKRVNPEDPYKIKMEALDQAVNELTGVKNENWRYSSIV